MMQGREKPGHPLVRRQPRCTGPSSYIGGIQGNIILYCPTVPPVLFIIVRTMSEISEKAS